MMNEKRRKYLEELARNHGGYLRAADAFLSTFRDTGDEWSKEVGLDLVALEREGRNVA